MKELKAKQGYYLTQSADVANEERTFIRAIKGANVNESDWRDATAEEKEAFDKAREEALKANENVRRR